MFDAGRATMSLLKGAYSCLCLVNGVGLVAFRDPHGIRRAAFLLLLCVTVQVGVGTCLSLLASTQCQQQITREPLPIPIRPRSEPIRAARMPLSYPPAGRWCWGAAQAHTERTTGVWPARTALSGPSGLSACATCAQER